MTTSHNLSFPYQPKEHHIPSLSDDFLNALIAEVDTNDILGITLAGSHVRGEATPFSDVDLACWVPDDLPQPLKRMVYRDGHLVSIGYKKGADVRRALTQPHLAIWVGASLQTPGVRRTLLDKDGSVTTLMYKCSIVNDTHTKNASHWREAPMRGIFSVCIVYKN